MTSITVSGSSRLANNQATGNGGAAYASVSLGRITVIQNSTLQGNLAGGNGGAAYTERTLCMPTSQRIALLQPPCLLPSHRWRLWCTHCHSFRAEQRLYRLQQQC